MPRQVRCDLNARNADALVRPQTPSANFPAQLGMAARRDYSEDLSTISAPTLIVAGWEDDVRTPADAEFIQQGIRGSTLVTINDAGHPDEHGTAGGF